MYRTITRHIALYIICLCSGFTAAAQAPVANFTAATTGGCSPLIVSFQDLSTGTPTQWHWDFGNGNTSGLQNPTASYFTPGTYTVSLTVTNLSGSNTMTRIQYITVYEPPVVNFTGIPTSGCFPLHVQFTDLSTAGAGNTNTAWLWDFGSGTTSTAPNPANVYNQAGLYTVTLKVTNDKGCTKTFTRNNYIAVTTGVKAAFTNTNPTVCNAPALISFTNTSTGPPTLSYQWDFGDGNTSTALSPSHTYALNGTYTATLIVSSTAGCSDTIRSNPIIIGGTATAFQMDDTICAGQPLQFTNISSPAPASVSWTFGDGGTSTLNNPQHTYAAPGTYPVWLHTTFSSCQDSTMQNVFVNPLPVADFTAPVTTACQAPLTVNFQDLSTGPAVNWLWDFGDGNTSTQQNPVHTYTSLGVYDVTLTVYNLAGCKQVITKTGFVRIQRAQISVNGLPAEGCVPVTINPVPVINSLDPIVSYQWDFGDGNTSTLQTPSHTYPLQGTYNVQLIVVSASGCRDTLNLPGAVSTGTPPIVDFSATPIPVCGKKPIYFTNLSSNAGSYVWHFGDGSTDINTNPVHIYTDTGYFSVTLIANNNGCRDSLTKVNYIRVNPPISLFRVNQFCNNRVLATFTDLSIAPQTWDWDFGDGNTSTLQNPSHTYAALGTYNVRLIVSNNGCLDTSFQLIHLVQVSPDFTGTPLTACRQALINFTAAASPDIVNYIWDFGDGNTTQSTLSYISHLYGLSGTYTVKLVTVDINGCRDSLIRTNYIRVNGPTAAFTSLAPTGCARNLFTFSDLSSSDGTHPITDWQWDFGDGTVQHFSAPPFQHQYNTVDTFDVKLVITDNNGCKDSTSFFNFIMTSDPTPDFSSNDTITCPGSTVQFTNHSLPAAVSSNWTFGDGGVSTATSPSHVYTNTGAYTVTLQITDGFGCVDSLVKTAYVYVSRPVAAFTMNDSISSCIPMEVQFTDHSQFALGIIWDFGPGEGTSSLPNPVHYYATPGVFPVSLITVSPGGCRDTATQTVRVYDTTGSRITYLPISGCKPLPVNLNTFTNGPMVSYIWDFGDGYTDTTITAVNNHLYSTFGNFLPRVIMQDPSGCLIPLQGPDTVYVTGANAKFGLDKKFFCDQGTVQFSDSTTFNDPVTSYHWDFGDGNTSAQQQPSHQYTTPGIYTVQLAITTQLGCRDTATKTQIIKVVQSPQTGISGDTIVCVNQSLTHQGVFLVPDTAVVHWQWTFPGGSYTVQNPPAQVYSVPGDYLITAIATDADGCADTTTKAIHVKPLPTVTMPGQMTIQAGFPVTIPATYSAGVNNWIWSPSTGLSCFRCATPDAGPRFTTKYQVYFTDVNGCANLGNITVQVICKDANLFIPNTFSPNSDGNNDIFYPRGRGLARVKLLRIFNRWGEVVFEARDFPVNDPFYGWNGSYKGRKPAADVYVYQAEVVCDNGDIIKLDGNISLIR